MSRKRPPTPSVARAIDADIRTLADVREQVALWAADEERLRKQLARYARRYGAPDTATSRVLAGKTERCTVSLQESRTVDPAICGRLTPVWFRRLVRRVQSFVPRERLHDVLDDREQFRALPRPVQKAIERSVTRTPFPRVFLQGEK